MLIALSAKNKLKLISVEYEELPITSPLRAYWERAHDMLISWILNTVSEQIRNHFTFVNSASALWSELQEHYSQLDAKAYIRLIHEEKQRDALKHQPITTPVSFDTFRNTYTSLQRNNNPNDFMPNTLAERRSTFRKGIFHAYYKKEGHLKEECYKLLGYPPGHQLHNKYQPPSQRRTSAYKGGRTVNMVVGDTFTPIDTSFQQFTPLDQ
nr:reverse transcriptase, RNA-dependent DNA polymerase [Tanacetum cinerariifolium]